MPALRRHPCLRLFFLSKVRQRNALSAVHPTRCVHLFFCRRFGIACDAGSSPPPHAADCYSPERLVSVTPPATNRNRPLNSQPPSRLIPPAPPHSFARFRHRLLPPTVPLRLSRVHAILYCISLGGGQERLQWGKVEREQRETSAGGGGGARPAKDSQNGGPSPPQGCGPRGSRRSRKNGSQHFFHHPALHRNTGPSPPASRLRPFFVDRSTAHRAVGSSPPHHAANCYSPTRLVQFLRRRRTATGRTTASRPVLFRSPLSFALARRHRSCSLRPPRSCPVPPERMQYFIVDNPSLAVPDTLAPAPRISPCPTHPSPP